MSVGLCSETGARAANEDYVAWVGPAPEPVTRADVAAAVADGVGGAKGGRVAAELAVRGFLQACTDLDPLLGVKRNAIAGLGAMNGWLHAQGRTDTALQGMACAFTAFVLRGRLIHVVHVGDTRLYRLRGGTLVRLTVDHVPSRGAIRNALTRALGAEAEVPIDYAVEPAREHDRYLLCSDGVHGGLSDRSIWDELQRRDAPEEAARRLVTAALDARTGDNATALVLDVVGLPAVDQLDVAATVGGLPILPAPRSGASVDGYRLGAMISDGRYARVFRAADETDGRALIVKFPKPAVGSEPLLRAAFLREAWIAARLASPFVPEVLEDAAERRNSLYTVMPFYEGETLERRLHRAPRVARAEGLRIAEKLAKGVAALHRAGVIHRDIKPDNVLLATDGGLKLLDLGVARLPHLEEVPGAEIPGTPSYMAPEMFAGAAGDERSDQYALAVTIYRMFARAYPYGEVEPFAKPRFNRPPASLLSHRPDLPAWLDQTLRRALAARPEDRFDDVVEFMFALEHGALSAAPTAPRRPPLLARDPLRFWQVASALLALGLLCALLWR